MNRRALALMAAHALGTRRLALKARKLNLFLRRANGLLLVSGQSPRPDTNCVIDIAAACMRGNVDDTQKRIPEYTVFQLLHLRMVQVISVVSGSETPDVMKFPSCLCKPSRAPAATAI